MKKQVQNSILRYRMIAEYDNYQILSVFKWTLYELCICILLHDFDQSEGVFQTQNTILKMTKVVLLLGFHVTPGMYMSSTHIKGQNVKSSGKEVTIWLVNIIITEHDQ